jgi:thiol-disulfide isomerase/thioredoxin
VPPIPYPLRAPELAPGEWIQGPAVSVHQSRGSVVLVDFWESTCVNCLRTLPYLKAWHERYAGRGLKIVGVHTPEFEVTADPAVVAAAVRELGIPYPVLLDAERGTWQLYANHYWPAKYLADPRGYLRFEHVGEGAYGQTEEWIQELLREAGDTAPMPAILAPLRDEDRPGAVCYPATREIYLGWHRGKLIADEGYRPEEDVRHASRPEPAPPGLFTARGLWHHAAEYLESREAGAELELVCDAVGVNLVAAPAAPGDTVAVEVRILEAGGEETAPPAPAVVHWDRPRMACLVHAPDFRRWHLVLRFPQPGTRVFTFSFETCVEPPRPS